MLSQRILAIVLNWNGGRAVEDCVEALLASRAVSLDVLVVDNASTDGSADPLEGRRGLQLIRNTSNLGYAAGNNVGLRWAHDRDYTFVAVINQDCRVEPECLAELYSFLSQDPTAGVAGPQILMEGSQLVESEGIAVCFNHVTAAMLNAGRLPSPGQSARRVDAVLGSALFLRVAAVAEVGYFDSRFFLYLEEVDLCYRLSLAGYGVYYLPTARAVHLGAAGQDPQRRRLKLYYLRRNSVLFVRKHGGLFHKLQFGLLSILSLLYGAVAVLWKGSAGWDMLRAKLQGYRDGWLAGPVEPAPFADEARPGAGLGGRPE